MKPAVIHSNSFAIDAAGIIAEAAEEAIRARGLFRLGLCGGRTPAPVYEELSRTAGIPWEHVHITFGDERCVPPDDPESNYRMARETLISKISIPKGNVWRMRGEIPPAEAAREYDAMLSARARPPSEARYRHDLLLLGVGGDGHTASLFPGTTALDETDRSVVANFVPKFNVWRVTVTYPLIAAARHVCFLANAGKAGVIDEILAGKGSYPAARVAPESGRLTWLVGG